MWPPSRTSATKICASSCTTATLEISVYVKKSGSRNIKLTRSAMSVVVERANNLKPKKKREINLASIAKS